MVQDMLILEWKLIHSETLHGLNSASFGPQEGVLLALPFDCSTFGCPIECGLAQLLSNQYLTSLSIHLIYLISFSPLPTPQFMSAVAYFYKMIV